VGVGAVQGRRHTATHARQERRLQLPLPSSCQGAWRCRRGRGGVGLDSESQEGVCRQRRHMARGAGAVGSTMQHAAPRCNTLQ